MPSREYLFFLDVRFFDVVLGNVASACEVTAGGVASPPAVNGDLRSDLRHTRDCCAYFILREVDPFWSFICEGNRYRLVFCKVTGHVAYGEGNNHRRFPPGSRCSFPVP